MIVVGIMNIVSYIRIIHYILMRVNAFFNTLHALTLYGTISQGMIKMDKQYYTYMLRCEDGSIYTGIAADLSRRMEEHFSKSEKCAKYTRSRQAKELDAAWESENRAAASKLEYHIKHLKKRDKEKLIAENDFSVFGGKIEEDKYIRCDLLS